MIFKYDEHWTKKKRRIFEMPRKKIALSVLNIKVSSSSKIIGASKKSND